jgi:hypothetical protein
LLLRNTDEVGGIFFLKKQMKIIEIKREKRGRGGVYLFFLFVLE